MKTVEKKTGDIFLGKIELVSDSSGRKFNVKFIPYDGEENYFFPVMVKKVEAREAYKLAQ